MDADKLENQLQALKLENLALKRSLGKIEQNDKTIYCNIGDYNGHPILTFNGPGRPFSIGLKKAKELDADILLGTDPDADRVGIGVKNNNGELIGRIAAFQNGSSPGPKRNANWPVCPTGFGRIRAPGV